MKEVSNIYVIFGGTGFVGIHLTKILLEKNQKAKIYLCDLNPLNDDLGDNVIFVLQDVRVPINNPILDSINPFWIFNFAAIHREPGHEAIEYFETNILGAKNVCEYAEKVGCKNLFFTSSIAVYGPCLTPTDESKLPQPITPYGGSKYPAELIHQNWLVKNSERRLIITRPGVIYGPGDPGNIMRMIKGIDKGYFFFPGRKDIHKSYAYIYGFLDSIFFTMNKPDSLIIYNYVESPTETIGEIAEISKKFLGRKTPIMSLPQWFLSPVAKLMQLFLGSKNPIHPVRVKKASLPTNITPQYLIDNNFEFKYSFGNSLIHWKEIKPDDFD